MKFGFASILVRWFMIMGVIMALYNTSGRSFVHWATATSVPVTVRIAVGGLLLAGFAFFIRLATRALGIVGVAIVAILLMSIALALVDLRLVHLGSAAAFVTFLQAMLATGLTVGVSYSAIRTRVSGQIDSDDLSRRWAP